MRESVEKVPCLVVYKVVPLGAAKCIISLDMKGKRSVNDKHFLFNAVDKTKSFSDVSSIVSI